MTAMIALLRGVNVTGHNKISMETLRAIFVSLKLRNPQTYIQSGNVVFATSDTDLSKLASRIEAAIEKRCGFRPRVLLRTADELLGVIARHPFRDRADLNPAKLIVYFLADAPPPEVAANVRALHVGDEEIHLIAREIFVHFPNGMGQSKLPAVLDRTLKAPATARNWNTVTKLLEMTKSLA